MAGSEFIRTWLEEAKKNQELDKEILEIIDGNLDETLNEDILLDSILVLSRPKGEPNETD